MVPSLNALIHCETGETRRLGEYHFILLETLAKNADTVLARSYLMTEVWKNRIVGGNSLPTAIHALRVAIDDDGKQQEIIKTIPKKGYLFNKNYLTLEFPAAQAETLDETTATAKEESSMQAQEAPETASAAPRQEENVIVEAEKIKRRYPPFLLPGIASILLITMALIFFAMPLITSPSPDAPQLVKEKFDNVSHIAAYHLYTTAPNKKTAALGARHIQPVLQHINALLVARNAKIELYYKLAMSSFTVDMVIKTPCNSSRQLALNFENWQNKNSEMNTVMYQEVEKLLKELPQCQ